MVSVSDRRVRSASLCLAFIIALLAASCAGGPRAAAPAPPVKETAALPDAGTAIQAPPVEEELLPPPPPPPAPLDETGLGDASSLLEEHLKSQLEAERQARLESVQKRILYPEELFGGAMIRKEDLGAGMVVFYYPLRATGAVSANAAEMSIKSQNIDEGSVNALMDNFKQYLETGDREEVKYYKNLNMLQITAKEENIPFILEVLNFLDSPRQQIILEAAVWEVTEANDTQLGADVTISRREGGRSFYNMFHSRFDTQAFLDALTTGQPFQGSTLQFVNTADGHKAKMDAVLQFVQSRGYADLVAQPRMRVMVGEVARIFTGEQIPFSEYFKVQQTRSEVQVKYQKIGVQLDIMATLVGQDEIEVVLVPSVSEVAGYSDSAVTGVANPIIIERKAATKVRVSNRELITIGGLDQKRTLVTESKVPILGDIPVIQYLFRYKREIKKNVQIWFTLRPTIAGETERIILPELTGMR